MKIFSYLIFAILFSAVAAAQVTVQDTTRITYQLKDTDTLSEPILLEEINIYKDNLDPESRKQFLLLRNRVYKVYPYALIASQRLSVLNKTMASLKSNREKKKYFKIVEDYMTNEFEDRLKKLSRKQGQILVKLVYRQTGITTFDLIKDLKSGFKAFLYSNTGKLFDIDIKAKYKPYEVNEDFLIESILYRAFNSGRLVKQESANPVDYDELAAFWEAKAKAGK